MISRAIIAPADAAPATSFMRMTVRRNISGTYAVHGNLGQTATADPTIPRGESGHPIRHQFTRSIPSSQCIVCHIHPGTNMVSTYFGYTWWDNEMDGEHMWPAEQRHPNANEQNRVRRGIPRDRQFAVCGPTLLFWKRPARLNSISNFSTRSLPISIVTDGFSALSSSMTATATCGTR